MSALVRLAISMPRDLMKRFDVVCRRRGLTNRSEALRELVRASLVEDQWASERGDTAGTVTLVYDHETLDLPRKLTAVQHRHGKLIVSAMHVHLDRHNCLEVLVLRGPSRRVRALGESLASVKGLKHSRFSMTTTGRGLR
jgi:CopG family nickel-responsive transcriptional regulator